MSYIKPKLTIKLAGTEMKRASCTGIYSESCNKSYSCGRYSCSRYSCHTGF